jgi:CheY-like chemotaxis protein
LLDVMMPEMSGWETLRALKESPETRAIPVIILSVVENRAFGLSLGAFDYLVKPLGRPELLSSLARAGVLASRGHVLVVDDEPDVRALLEQELVAAGFRARGAGSGEAALSELERERPSAVLLDLTMPPPDGFEVLYRIRENPKLKDLPVVIITARELAPEDYARLNGSAQRILRKGRDLRPIVREVLTTIEETRSAAPV